MNCDRYIELISERLDGVISPEDEKLLAAHLDECDECRAFAALMQAAHLELETMSAEPPETLVGSVMEAVTAERKAAGGPAGRKHRWSRYGALAAAVIVIVLAAYAMPKGVKHSDLESSMVAADTADASADHETGGTVSAVVGKEAEEESNTADLADQGDMDGMMMAPESFGDGAYEPEAELPEESINSVTTQGNSPTAASEGTMAPALPYSQPFSAILVCHGDMPAELEGYAFETGAETEVYVFVPTQEAQHMIESGAYTVYIQGVNLSPEAEMAIVVVYGEVPNA